jgi:hypothetical protein
MGHRRRVGSVGSRNDRDLQPLAPEFDLLNRRRAEGVARRQQGGLPARLDQVRQLGGGGGLAGAVDADNRYHRQPSRPSAKPGPIRGQAVLDFAPRDREHISARAALRLVSLLDRADNLSSHLRSQIGSDQRRFQFLEARGVQFGRAGDDAFDLVRQLVVCLLQASLEFREESHGSGCVKRDE